MLQEDEVLTCKQYLMAIYNGKLKGYVEKCRIY